MNQIIETIQEKINEARHLSPQKISAAFDADGTLWNTDIGEFFFEFQIRNNLLKGLPDQPLKAYSEKKSINTRGGLAWLAQINSGHPLEEVRQWAQKAADSFTDIPVFPQQQELIGWLQDQDIPVFVVTASCKWAVEPFAEKYFNIPKENVFGIETKVNDGLITDQVINPLTWRDGKKEKFQKATGALPTLAAGNTTGDEALLSSAKIALAVRANPEGHPLFSTEEELFQKAQQKGWLTYSFEAS